MVHLELNTAALIILPFYMALIGWLGGRLLGLRLGRWRAMLSALIGWLIAVVVVAAIAGGEEGQVAPYDGAVFFFAILATLPIAIAFDLFTRGDRPSKHRLRRFLRHPIRRTKGVFSPLGRFRELLQNARKENLVHVRFRHMAAVDSPEFARRLRKVLEDSGGMFVKFGQIASTRTDLLPPTVTNELEALQAEVRPAPENEVREVLEHELGEPTEQAFKAFEKEPLAAASIGQTHRATLHTGEDVVVKVQRPGIDELVRRDSRVLAFAANQVDRRVEAAHRMGAKRLAGELIVGIESELSYSSEATAGMQLRENRAEDVGVKVPKVYKELSTDRVLVQEAIPGKSIADPAVVDASPVPRPELAKRLLSSMLGQILDDGFYHADPHPGNIMIDAEGNLWLLDFGAVGRLDPITMEGLQGIALGFAMRDPTLLARAVRHLADDERAIDLRVLERELGTILGEVGDAGGLSPEVMRMVLASMDRHNLEPPGQMVLLSRTLLTLEGTLRGLNAQFELAREAESIVQAEHAPDTDDYEEMAKKELIRALPALRSLPDHAETLANQLRLGRLTVRQERYATEDRQVVEQWFNRTMVGLAGGFGAIASALVIAAGALTTTNNDVQLALWILGFSGLALSSVMVMRTVAQAIRRLPARQD